ncbi:MAG: 3-phytase [Flammeovirgaceae bacterium]|nr:3-phytase [Flammeovirgaceae bacterium]HCX20822.1 3-phytase [Cytophagales bacterium]|tara:strand:- start:15837 stop:16886 length:1050 start_codon:yes stop_codon:yes gene_type:complete
MKYTYSILALGFMASCMSRQPEYAVLQPTYVTDSVNYDSDDPAIWINRKDPQNSLILGTDKQELDGGLYAFDLKGNMLKDRKGYPLDRPNNVDIVYDVVVNGDTTDIAVATERGKGQIRVFSLPELQPIDNGGIKVFEDDSLNNKVMGVALYKRPSDNKVFAIVSRKEGTANVDKYLYQYELVSDSLGLKGNLVRKFGQFSNSKEIEAVAVDAELGYVYYSDEHFGVRKYYADPEKGDEELAQFALDGFTDDREGISIYKTGAGTGYLIVSDQGANQFQVFPREGTVENPHQHDLIATIRVTAMSSDGSESTSIALGPEYPKGLFVAMSDNKTFEIYDWREFEKHIINR